MKLLFLITARGGSKGLPGKNIRDLNGKPLLHYSIDFARKFADDVDICLSTDDESIISVANEIKLPVPFTRPEELARDNSGSYEVILHALDFYEKQSKIYDAVVLLQPTSPFRKKIHLNEMLKLFTANVDSVVSVVQSKNNPFFNLYKSNQNEILEKAFDVDIPQRQNAPEYYYLNGSIYVLRVSSLRKYSSISAMPNKAKYEMDQLHSADIDTLTDFRWCEFLLQEKLVES